MNFSKIKAILALLSGGFVGILKYLVGVINTQVLGRIKDQKTALKYLKDVQAVSALVRAFLANHAEDMSESQKEAGDATLAALDELTKALEDFKVEETELDSIIDKINRCIDAWKAAKKK